ncbi:thioredoxin-disulfide reductase [Candidatus Marinamargulisbacteria bacterium SCGC AG-414-C22]|nr:thioredoxin-disulfide reductase [Candidatus Marinamargulisbacteria bacterium SCGC AG-414-C22]
MTIQEETNVLEELNAHHSEDIYDIIIIGSGPAGMSAAVCAGRAKLKVLVIDKTLPGGQTATAYNITNYLGFPEGILGQDLSLNMESHFKQYNINYSCETVVEIMSSSEPVKKVKTDLDNVYKTKTVIMAMGLEPKALNMDFEKKFLGRGISYYAQSDVETYQGKDVAVIGGGNCACYAADYLSQFVNKLFLIHRSDYIKAVASLKEKVMNNPKITILWDTQPVDAFGIDKVEKIKLQHILTQQTTWLTVNGVFVYVGRIPPTDLMLFDLDCDEKGYIITDEYMRTNIPGIYAAGDIRSKQIRQIATAVSDGMIAAINAAKE